MYVSRFQFIKAFMERMSSIMPSASLEIFRPPYLSIPAPCEPVLPASKELMKGVYPYLERSKCLSSVHLQTGETESEVIPSQRSPQTTSPLLFTLQSSLLTFEASTASPPLTAVPVALSLRLLVLLRLPSSFECRWLSLSSLSSTGLLPSCSSPSFFDSLALPPTPSPAPSGQIPPANFLVSHLACVLLNSG
ncbi:hypothetical protein Cgig2_018178 [Carnegiea gigantea]|uniref:Uncharacterized protein n=1 Tax=Carnegiea gigantea TaxID=171969 RepID=A0A9Q1QRJ7_9CARY|nr:hypothetical protein Cgig2_018178 [Carnegiea gigantea]